MSVLLGFTILYLIPGVLAAVFWLVPVRRLIKLWDGRDFMESLIPDRRHIAFLERLLRLTHE